MCDRMTGPPPPKRLRISELNPHLLCALCGGYLIDATTIIECLHSFCKTCILRYLETSNYCPICEVLIHKTRPWQNIRLDHSLQNAVYKMVPGLFQNEMRRRREFYEKQNVQDKRGRPSNQPQGQLGDRIIFSQDEEFSISIEFSPDGKPAKEVKENKTKSLKRPKGNCPPDKRYLKCPAGLRIEHLKKFIRSKFTLPQTVEIDLFYETEALNETFSLMDVAYIYSWKRDCVLRLFYSFYEIPSKLRKVETVTNVTEVSKSKVNDNSQEKSDKRDNGKLAKGKKEKSREKRQSKLSGKRKVNSDGTAPTINSASNPDLVVAAEISTAESIVKDKEPDTESMSSSQNGKFFTKASPSKTDKHCGSSSVPDRCTNKSHNIFQSPTKQKPPPEVTSYSVIAHSINKEGKNSKGQDSKTSLKLLIKSSDIKDCQSLNGETFPEGNDRKYQSCEAPSKTKVKKCQNGETHSILKSNLFEKMDTFARSSQVERREFSASSASYSSPFQNVPNNYKRFKADDGKCDIKLSVNITEANTAPATIQTHQNVKSECVSSVEIVRNQVAHSQTTSLNIDKVIGTKHDVCTASSINDRAEACVVMSKHADVTDMKQVGKDTAADSKIIGQSTSEAKKDVHVNQEGQQIHANEKKKANTGQLNEVESITHSSDHKIPVGLNCVGQDNNQNDTKLWQLEDGRSQLISKENSSKQVTCDTKMAATETQQKNIMNDSRQKREETKHTPKQITANPQQRNTKQIADDNKQCSDDVRQKSPEVNLVTDSCQTTFTKTSPDATDTHIGTQKLHNWVAKGTETSLDSVTAVTCNKTPEQDYAVSKVVISAGGNNGSSCYSRDHDPLNAVADRVKAENKQQVHQTRDQKQSLLSSQNSDIPTPPSKPLTFIPSTTPKVASAGPQVRVHSSQVMSSQAKLPSNGSPLATSNKQPMVFRGATTTSSFSTLPTPPKLLKTTPVATTNSSSCLPTAYSIASMVSVPAVTTSSIPTPHVIGKSVAQSTSTTSVASSIAKVSRACEVTSTVSAKTAPSLACASTAAKPTLPMPLISTATTSSSAASQVSGAKDLFPKSMKEKNTDSSPALLVCQRKIPDTTSSPSDTPSKISTSACAPSKALITGTTAPTTVPSIALSITTPPIASSGASSTTATSSIPVSATATNADNWTSSTILNVANTFLHIPLTEKSALKETPVRNNAKPNAVSSSNMLKQKEAMKLDNFLYDTKSVEMETTVSSQNVKDSCTVMKQGQKTMLRTKPNSSTQLHGLPVDKSSKNQGSHITAIHNLPKTISQTSKPYSMARSMSVSSTSSSKCNIIQTTKISTLIPKSNSITSKAGSFSKSFSYPSTINNVPSSRSFLHTSLASHLSRSEMPAVINGSSGYERAVLTKAAAFPSSFSLQTSAPASSTSHHRTSSSKHSSKDGDKLEKSQKNKVIPPLTIPKSCLVGTTLKLQRSPGSTDYIFAPLSHYAPTSHHNGERSKSKEGKHNGSRLPTSPPTSTEDRMLMGERQRVPTIKISDINRNPIIVDSSASGNGSSGGNRHNPPYRSFSHGSSRSSSSENGSARTHSRGGSDSSSPTGSSDKSDRSPARDARRPSDSELLLSQHWHGYSAADLLFNGFKLPTHPKFHDLHYDTDAMPLDYSQSSSKS